MGGSHLPLTLPAFRFCLPFVLTSILLQFCACLNLVFHLMVLKLSPGTILSPQHRVSVLEPRYPSALFPSILCVAQQGCFSFGSPLSSANRIFWPFMEMPCQSGWVLLRIPLGVKYQVPENLQDLFSARQGWRQQPS